MTTRQNLSLLEKSELLDLFGSMCKESLKIRLCKLQCNYTAQDDIILSGLQLVQHEIDSRIARWDWL